MTHRVEILQPIEAAGRERSSQCIPLCKKNGAHEMILAYKMNRLLQSYMGTLSLRKICPHGQFIELYVFL
jgi:hypothetical protein